MASATAAARRAGQAALDLEVLPHREVRVGAGALDEVADAREHVARARSHAPAQDLDLAGAGPDEAEEHADGGRLAGAVPAEEAVDLAAPHAEVERVDGEQVAVALAEGVRGDGVGGAHVAALPCSRARAGRARRRSRARPASARAGRRRARRSAARRARTTRRRGRRGRRTRPRPRPARRCAPRSPRAVASGVPRGGRGSTRFPGRWMISMSSEAPARAAESPKASRSARSLSTARASGAATARSMLSTVASTRRSATASTASSLESK